MEKTKSECLSDAGFSCRNLTREDHAKLEKAMEDYKNQGRNFTADDIAKIQEEAYQQGFNAGLTEL